MADAMEQAEAECAKGSKEDEEGGAGGGEEKTQGESSQERGCGEGREAAASSGAAVGASQAAEGARSGGDEREPPAQGDLETRLRIAESELILRREQEEALRKRLGDAALWAAEAARQLGAERRRGEVRCATAAAFEAEHRAALKAAEELRVRLDGAIAERDAAARAAVLLKDEIADLKQQLQMQGQHLNCQLDLENAAVKYQGKIKEFLLLICRNLKQLEEEQEMLKRSVTNVSTISEKMEKGINHYSCKEKIWTVERQNLEKKVVELRAEVKRLNIQSEKAYTERTKYYEGVVADLRHNLNIEKENNTRLLKNLEEIKGSGMNYEHKIEELIHQMHEKKEHIERLEKEKSDLHNMIKHNEREMEIMERKHKYELDYARQKPLAFSCETQTEATFKEADQSSDKQTHHSDCTVCFTKAQCVYKQKRRLNRPNTPYFNNPGTPSIISFPSSQNNGGSDSVPFIYKYNDALFSSNFAASNLNPVIKTEPISLDSLGPVDDHYDSQWYTRRCTSSHIEQNSGIDRTVQNPPTKIIMSIDIANEDCCEVSNDNDETSKTHICEETPVLSTSEIKSPMASTLVLEADPCNKVQNKTMPIKSQAPVIENSPAETSEVETNTIISSGCLHRLDVQNTDCEQNAPCNLGEKVCNLPGSVQQTTGSANEYESDSEIPPNKTKIKRRIFKVLH